VHTLLGGVRPLDGGTAFRDARGAVWLPGDATGAGPLRRRAELETLRAALADAAGAREAAAAAAGVAGAALAAAEREATAAFAGATATQRALHDAQARHAEAARLHERAARDVHDAEGAIARLGARRSELGDTLASVDAGARDVAAALATHEAAIAAARAAFAAAEDAHEAAREARTAATIAHGQRTAELQVAADREGRLAAERATATQRLDALAAELARLTEAGAAVARQMAAWRLDLESRRASLADVDARLAAAERRVAEADQGLHAADHALDEARGAEHEAADALHLAELRHADLASRRSVIQGRLEAEWRRPLAELFAGFAPVEGDDATVRADAEEVRQQLEALGPVNPLAVEEHEEELKRLDFLTQQRADLGEAQRTLQQAIREIDSTARDLFLGTFAAVRENFRQIFLTLFGGGECDLRLEDPERPLDCDIEIHAAPRGKRTQRIHLLSSGERALVALSLLFGIFLSKPSPFCLLDEVDAPLDDANIGRFVRMLNEFKQKTQFIVITHNPRTTTEAADAVYGVTMQEPGVSSLVSVRMTGRPVDDEDPAASGAAA
jgi:chromosome segregation protein